VATSVPASPALTGERWRARRLASWTLRALIFLAPLAAAIIASLWLSSRLFEPESAPGILAWWAILIGVSSLVSWAVDRVARRLLPLTLMLKVTMLFPDRAPSRYKVALRRANITELRRRVAEADANTDLSTSAELILSLGRALNEHDRRTRGHGERTRAYTDILAEELKIPDVDRDKLRWAALLHDIGKLDVPAEILNKDGPLEAEEHALIRRHPMMGMRVAAAIVPWLGEWAGAIEHHHEWWDGSGYPRGLKGEEISLAARIVSVADAFDVMTSGRAYQAAKSPAEARREIARMAGTQFDPTVARALMNVSLGRLRWAIGPVTWLGQIPFYLDRLGRDILTLSTAATVTAAAVIGGVIPVPDVISDFSMMTAAETLSTLPNTDGPEAEGAGDEPLAPGAPALETAGDTAPDTTATTTPTTTSTTVPGTTAPPPTEPPTTGPPATTPTTTPPTTAPPRALPTANPDVASTNEDVAVTIDVLANDSPGLTLASVDTPGSGTTQTSAGKVRYVPAANTNGTDSFGYEACDAAGNCTRSTVAVRVNPVNDPPVAANDSASTVWGEAVTVNVLNNDVDIDGDALRVPAVTLDGPGTASTNGTTVTYVSPIDFTGNVAVRYQACDPAGACSPATLTITVNPGPRPPKAANDTATANQKGRATIKVLANDSDPDGDLDATTVTVVDSPAHGTTAIQNSGHIQYQANSGFSGTDSFTYRVCDRSGLCDTATVTVSVP
jgi:putative nucleotidyltransferase with HDIG domain